MTKRWKIFAVLALLFIVGFFYRVSMAVVSRDLAADLGLSAAQLGVMSAIYFYAFAFSQIPLGPLIDRFGGRAIISILGVVTTCGSLTFALAPNYLTALAGRGLLGLGTAAILMGSLKIFTRYFSAREFPRVSGFMIAAGNLGSVIATAPLAFAIGIFTWRPIFLAMTVAQALATVSVFLIARDARSVADNRSAAPPARSSAGTGVLGVWKLLLVSPDFWLISLIAFFWYANYMVLLALWGGPYLMEGVGLGRSQAGAVLLYTSAGYICGSLLLGKAIDWLGGSLEKTILCGQSLLLLAMSAMLGPADHIPGPLLAAVFFAVGLFSASGVMIYPLARKLVPPHSAATAMTCVNFFLLMGAATMQHIMGYYIYSFPRTPAGYPAAAYHGAFLIPICGLACTLVLFSLRRLSKGFDLKHDPEVSEGSV
jgi:predicted MFS family arabinose efflux permease